MSNSIGIRRALHISCASLILFGCSYNAANINQYLNLSPLEEIHKTGEYKINLKFNSEMSGDALVLGNIGSAHKYKYDFSPHFENSVRHVLEKNYQMFDLNIYYNGEDVPEKTKIMIDIAPVNVRLNCVVVSQYAAGCAAKTLLSGVVTMENNEEHHISVENEQSSKAGSTIGGAVEAISASIGFALNEFSGDLYNILNSQ